MQLSPLATRLAWYPVLVARVVVLRILHAAYLMHMACTEGWQQLLLTLRSTPDIQKVPDHLGVALGDEPLDMRQLAALVGWCADLGIRRITVCDSHGQLLQAADRVGDALSAHLAYPLVVVWPGGRWDGSALPATSPPPVASPAQTAVSLNLTSPQAGRDDLVNAARQLCELELSGAAAPVDERAVEQHLTAHAGWPDPELVLQLCPEAVLGGVLPWHCRVTHYVHMGPLQRASRKALHTALLEYGGVQQRYGK